MKREKGLIIALYVAVLPSLALAEEAIPMPEVLISPGLACAEPRQWGGNDLSGRAFRCLDVGLGLPFSRTVSLRVGSGIALAQRGIGLRYRYSSQREFEFTRLPDRSMYFVYRHKL